MSRIVRGVGRAISGVVRGVTNAVKKVARSPIGRVLVTAAGLYFGVPAVMGAFGAGGAAAAGGLSGLSGAAANVSAAWSNLASAGSAVMSGNFSQAASSLGSGVTGGAVAGPPASLAAPQAASPWVSSSTGLQVLGSEATGTAAGTAGSTASRGLVSSMMSSPYAAPAMITAGANLVGGAIQGFGQQRALEEQREFDLEQQRLARERYNDNMGTSLWGDAPRGPQPVTGTGALPVTIPGPNIPPPPVNYQVGPLATIDYNRIRGGLIGSRMG